MGAFGGRRCPSVPDAGAFGAFGAFGACASWCVTVPVPAWPFRCDFLVNLQVCAPWRVLVGCVSHAVKT